SVEKRRHEVDQRENGCEREKRWECTGQGLGAEEADRRRPQREGGNGQGTERRRRREVAEKGGQEVEPGREHVSAERGDGDEIRDRRQQKSEGYRPPRRMAGRGDEDEREIEGVPDGEGEIGSASLLRVANAGGGDDPRRRERECGAEKRAGGHATTQGSGVTCQRGVSATFVWALRSTRKVRIATACVASATSRPMRATETASVAALTGSVASTTL